MCVGEGKRRGGGWRLWLRGKERGGGGAVWGLGGVVWCEGMGWCVV